MFKSSLAATIIVLGAVTGNLAYAQVPAAAPKAPLPPLEADVRKMAPSKPLFDNIVPLANFSPTAFVRLKRRPTFIKNSTFPTRRPSTWKSRARPTFK